MSAAAAPERAGERLADVGPADVANALRALARDHAREGHRHATARTLNLVVAVGDRAGADEAARRLDALAHHPSRTILLAAHAADRLDAEVTLACRVASAPERPGDCSEEVRLTADAARLAHVDSLLAPLLVDDLPTVAWLADPTPGPAEDGLAALAEWAVMDSGTGRMAAGLARARALGARTAVHDLVWGRLAWWRARVASAFDPPAARALVPRLHAVGLRHGGRSPWPALLLGGWIAACAGWQLEGAVAQRGRWALRGHGTDGGSVELVVEPAPGAAGLGGVERITLRAGETTVDLARSGAGEPDRDLLVDAVAAAGFGRGYARALAALPPGVGA